MVLYAHSVFQQNLQVVLLTYSFYRRHFPYELDYLILGYFQILNILSLSYLFHDVNNCRHLVASIDTNFFDFNFLLLHFLASFIHSCYFIILIL